MLKKLSRLLFYCLGVFIIFGLVIEISSKISALPKHNWVEHRSSSYAVHGTVINMDSNLAVDEEKNIVSNSGYSGYVTITYDDGNLSVYNNAYPLHLLYQYPGVNYVITNRIGKERCMTIEQLREMEAAGWETGSHTFNHLNLRTLNNEGLEEEIGKSCTWLAGQKLMHNSFSYPFGSVSADWLVKDNYSSAVLASGNRVNVSPVEPYKLVRVPLYKDNVKNIPYFLEQTAVQKGWLILYTHNIYDNELEPDAYSINKNDLSFVFEKIRQYNLEVVTISEGLKLLQ